MAKKKILRSGLILEGVAPNILLQHVEHGAPFLFNDGVDLTLPRRGYISKLIAAKKNMKSLQNLNLKDYFDLCLSAHWATAGSFVPTNVDNQIREGLWRHQHIGKHCMQDTINTGQH